MRILISRGVYGGQIGGAEKEIIELSKILIELGHTVFVITNSEMLASKLPPKVKSAIEHWPRSEITLLRILLTPLRQFLFKFKLQTLVKEVRADVLLPQSKEDGLALIQTRKRHGLSVVWRDHSDLMHQLRSKRRNMLAKLFQNILVRTLPLAQEILTVSSTDAKHIHEFAPTAKVSVVHPEVMIGQSNLKRKQTRNPKDIVVGYVGRLVASKGVQNLIIAIGQLEGFVGHCWIVGDGDYRGELEKLASKSRNKIDFLGYRDDVDNFFRKIDILVQPSEYEGWGKTVREAMLYGCAVIASSIPSHKEQIKNMETGLLFELGNQDELLSKLKLLVSNSGLRSKLGKQAAAAVRKSGGFEQVIKTQFLPILESAARIKT